MKHAPGSHRMVQCQGVELKQRVLISGFIAIVCSGCATSGDMSYQYSRHGAQCVELGREIASGITDENGALRLSIESSALGGPGAGRLVARTDGDASAS